METIRVCGLLGLIGQREFPLTYQAFILVSIKTTVRKSRTFQPPYFIGELKGSHYQNTIKKESSNSQENFKS
jgi:hypothetical protein